jgi:hypothetical protein
MLWTDVWLQEVSTIRRQQPLVGRKQLFSNVLYWPIAAFHNGRLQTR